MMLRFLLVCSSILMLSLPTGFAQTTVTAAGGDYPGLDIQAELGWDGFIDARTPTPNSFLSSNNSQDVLAGKQGLPQHNTIRTLVRENLNE